LGQLNLVKYSLNEIDSFLKLLFLLVKLDNPKKKNCLHTWVLKAKFNAKLSAVIQPSSGHTHQDNVFEPVFKQVLVCLNTVKWNVTLCLCMPWGWLYYRKLGIKFCFKDSSLQTIYLFFGLSSGICLAPCLPWVRWNSFIFHFACQT